MWPLCQLRRDLLFTLIVLGQVNGFRIGVSLSLALSTAVLEPASAQSAAEDAHPVPVLQQRPAGCLPAAAAMALQGLGHSIEPDDIARRIPMYPDGADFFDLQNELTVLGYESLVFQGSAQEASAAVRTGNPVIAAVKQGELKHAVLAHGWSGGDEGDGALRIVDPDGGRRYVWTAQEFDDALYAGQMMVIFPSADGGTSALQVAGFPLERAQQQNGRCRAKALLLRARRHEEPTSQQLALLERAVQEDPTLTEAHDMLMEVRAALGSD